MMQKELTGCIIKATAALDDTFFENAVIFITEHNEKGAAGFLINRLFQRKLNELAEFALMSPIDIYEGGPVDNEHLYLIHNIESLGGVLVKEDVYFGGDIHAAGTQLSNGTISSAEVKIFIGYCGWNNAELEAEIEEGSWEITGSTQTAIFNKY